VSAGSASSGSTGDVALRFVRALHAGDEGAAAALVSPAVRADTMTAETLRKVWLQLTDRMGPLADVRSAGTRHEDGRLVADLVARFARSELGLRVVLDDARRVVGFWVTPPRPPAYEPPAYADRSRFSEAELTLGREPSLPATLTIPVDAGPWAIVVLVHGSGPNDRDETLGANRPYRDLAWGLATRGVAVLRYDKRTLAHPRSLGESVTVEAEVIDDALAALAVARTVDGVDPARVVLLGHSLGAGLAPEIAARDGAVAGAVLLAPPARPSAEVLAEQLAYVDGADRAAGGTGVAGLAALRELLRALGDGALSPEVDVLGAPASYFYDLDARRPLDTARALPIPLLALFGGRDYQVTGDDAQGWRQALAGRTSATVRTYPELNHLFMAGQGMATPAEYAREAGHVAAVVIDDIVHWLASTVRPQLPSSE
jgi:dienelactone hydrolase